MRPVNGTNLQPAAVASRSNHEGHRSWLSFMVIVVLVGIVGELLSGPFIGWFAQRAASQGRLTHAVQWLSWSQRLAPWSLNSHWLAARCLRRRGDHGAWTTRVEQLAAASPKDPRLAQERELMRIQSGQFDRDAEGQLKRLLMANVNADDVAEAFVRGYLVRQNSFQADEVLAAWTTLHPQAVDITYYRGAASQMRGDLDQARTAFLTFLAVYPHHELARESVSELLLELHQPRVAVHHFKLALRENSQSLRARVGAAQSLRQLGKWSAAEQLLREPLSRPNPTHAVLREAGLLAMETGNYELAETRLVAAAKLQVRSRDDRLATATVFALHGHSRDGRQMLDQQSQLDSLNKRRRDLQVTLILEPTHATARRELESVAAELRRISP